MTRKHMSTLTLHRYRYGELSPAEAAEVEAWLAAHPDDAARLEAQVANRKAFELEPVPRAIRQLQAAPEASGSRWWSWLAAPLLVAATVLVAIPRVDTLEEGPPIASDVRTKGANKRLEAWVARDGGSRPVVEGETIRADDRIQLRVRRPPLPWVSLAGTGPDGAIEVYGSFHTDPAAEGWQSAPFALGLDGTPGRQRFHAVFTAQQPQPELVRRILSNQAPNARSEVETLTVEAVE